MVKIAKDKKKAEKKRRGATRKVDFILGHHGRPH